MRQIVYKSTVQRNFEAGDLGPILFDARYHNRKNAVTGLLLYDGRHFLQALEGEPRDVGDTLAHIAKDKRHRSMVIISDRTTDCREFGNWEMATRIREDASYTKDVLDLIDRVSCDKVKDIFAKFSGTILEDN